MEKLVRWFRGVGSTAAMRAAVSTFWSPGTASAAGMAARMKSPMQDELYRPRKAA